MSDTPPLQEAAESGLLQPRLVRLRLAYNGDYPGFPCAWINDRPLDSHEERLLIRIMGSDEKRGLRGLMEHVGAKPTRCGQEHKEWHGNIEFTSCLPNAEVSRGDGSASQPQAKS